ncbi:ATP-binding protein [Variovorax sp. OV329]|uniref:ATP-binding protein n=1 Tax=Variovorax sp. OV329 TaxID=1882825 RepID=UPI001587D923|nr:ATP-binding protein [Variovorax sp. OV329]
MSVASGPWDAWGLGAVWLAAALAWALCLALIADGRQRLSVETARHHAMKMAMREQQRFQRAVLEGMPHAIAVRDAQARLSFCNGAYLKLLGVSWPMVTGKSLPEAVAEGENAGLARDIHQGYLHLLAEGSAISDDLDLRVGGEMRRVIHWASPIAVRPDGAPQGLVSGVVDITARHRLAQLVESARSKAEAASRAKSGFLATMSHEIRTPMNAVLGVLELLLREGRLAQPDRDSAELALGAAHALLSLIDDALDLSKVEAGALDLVARPMRLSRLVREVADVFQGLASQRGLRFEIEIDESLQAWHEADAARLRQILNNLVSNAIRFTDAGEVAIRLASQGVAGGAESVLLEIADTGIGMDPEDVRKLFRPFFQATAAGARTQGGTGLGLTIAQRLVERMGGEIAVDSRRDKGTSIRVRLPLTVSAPPEPGAETDDEDRSGPPAPMPGRLHILVADDHPANRLLLQRQLAFLGFEAVVAEDGRQALAIWQGGGIDAVIADCAMPVMDGYTLAARIRAIEQERGGLRCPILGCTAHVREQDRHLALDAGMDECLAKPLALDELRRALQRRLLDARVRTVPQHPAADLDGALRTVAGGDPGVEAEFLATLLHANVGDLVSLAGLVRTGAGAQAASLAHRIKGAARLVRARQVQVDCEVLEAAVLADRRDEALHALAALQASVGELNNAISKRLREGGSLAH